jgi:hypothetical protein
MKNMKWPLVVLEYPGRKEGGMMAQRYINQVLEGALIDFHAKMKCSRPGFQFQQDGAGWCSSSLCKDHEALAHQT